MAESLLMSFDACNDNMFIKVQKQVWDGFEINTFRVRWLTNSVSVISVPRDTEIQGENSTQKLLIGGGGGGGKSGALGWTFVLLLPTFIVLLFPLSMPLCPPDWEGAVLSWLILVGCRSRGDHQVPGWPIDFSGGHFREGVPSLLFQEYYTSEDSYKTVFVLKAWDAHSSGWRPPLLNL